MGYLNDHLHPALPSQASLDPDVSAISSIEHRCLSSLADVISTQPHILHMGGLEYLLQYRTGTRGVRYEGGNPPPRPLCAMIPHCMRDVAWAEWAQWAAACQLRA